MPIPLLTNQVTNGLGNTVTLSAKPGVSRLGISAWGTFGGGTVTVEFSMDGTNYVTVATFSSSSFKIVDVVAENGSKIRAYLSGSTGANVNCQMAGAYTAISKNDA